MNSINTLHDLFLEGFQWFQALPWWLKSVPVLCMMLITGIALLCRQAMIWKPINIIVLGSNNSGKTIFMATMFNKWKQPGREGFSLDTNIKDRNELMSLYIDLANPKNSHLPDPNQVFQEKRWVFHGYTTKTGLSRLMAKINYLDYAGEVVARRFESKSDTSSSSGNQNGSSANNPGDLYEISRKFEKTAASADILMVIIDGIKVFDALESPNTVVWTNLERDLEVTLDFTVSTRQERRPVHLILTKWDILQNKYNLDDVIIFLKTFDVFRSFLESREKWCDQLRLIPISALGLDYVEADSSGTPIKTGKPMRPLYIKIPLACAMIDVLKYRISAYHNSVFKRIMIFLLTLSRFCLIIIVIPPLFGLTKDIELFTELLKYNTQTIIEDLQHRPIEHDSSKPKILDTKIQSLIGFANLIEEFEGIFQGSNLLKEPMSPKPNKSRSKISSGKGF